MWVDVIIGIPEPTKVDTSEVLSILPHGTGKVTCLKGGLEIYNSARKDWTVMANAADGCVLDRLGRNSYDDRKSYS